MPIHDVMKIIRTESALGPRRERSPYLCQRWGPSSPQRRRALLACLFLCLLLCALLSTLGAALRLPLLFAPAAALLSAAALCALCYLWSDGWPSLWRRAPKGPSCKQMEISTLNYYSQVPYGRKSDFPMGPYLIMTLPNKHNQEESPKSRPLCHKSLRRSKNIPPLASAETLSPSLVSSCYGSIDSVV